jgi:hypothetical protein
VTVDGEDVGDGTKFVVDANDSIDLERFIKNGNFNAGNRFKFIERTSAVEKHRGVGIEDGLVRIEFQFEAPISINTITTTTQPWKPWDNTPYWYNGGNEWKYSAGDFIGQPQATFTASSTSRGVSDTVVTSNNVNVSNVNDAGVTVPGSVSDQQFVEAGWFPLEAESHVMVLKILGETKDNIAVRKPVTVKTKPKCTTCGSSNKATAKFCTECGTSLTIV